MDPVLGRISLPLFAHLASLTILLTIILCYTLAVAEGHVKPWLPMISDCAVLSPEKYPFRLGMVSGALLLGAQAVMIYAADKVYSRSKATLVVGLIAISGLATVAVVNEVENSSLHGTAAVVFFVLYWVYMLLLTWGTSLPSLLRACGDRSIEVDHQQPSSSFFSWFRHALTIVCGVALIAFIIMSSQWSRYHLYIAICEWTATFAIICFNWSYADDLSTLSLAEVQNDNSKERDVNDSHKISL